MMRAVALVACVALCACGGGNRSGGGGGGAGGGGSGGGGGGSGVVSKLVKLLDVTGMISLTGTDTSTGNTSTTASSSMTISLDAANVAATNGVEGSYVKTSTGSTLGLEVPYRFDETGASGSQVQNGITTPLAPVPHTNQGGDFSIHADWTNQADVSVQGVNTPCPVTVTGGVTQAIQITFTAHTADIESGMFVFTANMPIHDQGTDGVHTWSYDRTIDLKVTAQLQ